MNTVIEAIREVLGEADFYRVLEAGRTPTWDYSAMFEYMFAGVLLVMTVAFALRLILKAVER